MALAIMNAFETTIKEIRDVLRTEGITGMDSINHCLAFVLARTLTPALCAKLDIPVELAYENIMKGEDDSIVDCQTLFERFINYNAFGDIVGGLLSYFVDKDKLKMSNLKSFKLHTPRNLAKIMTKLGALDMDALHMECDIVGLIYELHLKSGTSGAMRDPGQYFTSRKVIDYMVRMCNPTLGETVADFSMGTGGMLTMAIKYLNAKHPNIDWATHKQHIYGFDIDENVTNLARQNALIEGKEMFPNLVQCDTLRNDMMVSPMVRLDRVKVLLANEPMGLKNITHAECCERIKDLRIRGTKAEPLFLQLAMQALDVGGRCAIIVPDGMLFNESKLHVDTRKHLIETFDVKKVIALDGDFFLNTGVKTSIIYFENNGRATHSVDFCHASMVDGALFERHIASFSKDDVASKSYKLYANMFTNNEAVHQAPQGQWPMRRVDELCVLNPTGSKHFTDADEIEYIDLGSVKEGCIGQPVKLVYGNRPSRAQRCVQNDDILWGSVRPLSRSYGILTDIRPNTLASTGFVVVRNKDPAIINTKYLYYMLTTQRCVDYLVDRCTGATYPAFKASDLGAFTIQVPPMNEQLAVFKLDDIKKEYNKINIR